MSAPGYSAPRGYFKSSEMLYALLCYGSEDVACEGTPQDVDADEAGAELARLDLLPTTTSVTVRGLDGRQVIDGPAVNPKEQLLGLRLTRPMRLEDAIAMARSLLTSHHGMTACEVRSVACFRGGADTRRGD